jgi:hypothetical protein
MNEQDDKLAVHEELQEADLIPDAFPEQDPKVDREWEKAKEDPMGGESPSSWGSRCSDRPFGRSLSAASGNRGCSQVSSGGSGWRSGRW